MPELRGVGRPDPERGGTCVVPDSRAGAVIMAIAVEDLVEFRSGTDIRALRGKIVREDAFFIYLERRDGVWQIGKASVIKIHRRPVRQGAGT